MKEQCLCRTRILLISAAQMNSSRILTATAVGGTQTTFMLVMIMRTPKDKLQVCAVVSARLMRQKSSQLRKSRLKSQRFLTRKMLNLSKRRRQKNLLKNQYKKKLLRVKLLAVNAFVMR